MKVCISVRDPVPANPREGNLRSEGRWERCALEACTSNPEITELYTVGYEWFNGRNFSSKYKGRINNSTAKDCVLLIQDFNQNIINQHPWKGIICNVFTGPWMHEIEDYKRLQSQYQKKLVMTVGFPNFYKEEQDTITVEGLGNPWIDGQAMGHLLKFTERENILLLPTPGAPYVVDGNGWNRTQILWSWRTIFFSQMYDNYFIFWALNHLRQNPALTLKILTGFKPEEIKLYENEKVIYNIKEEINSLFWSQKTLEPYLDVKNRVQLHYAVTWEQVLQEYNQSKILAMHEKFYGGPPIEASMHGIPFIGTSKNGAMAHCTEYMYVNSKEEASLLLDRLLIDQEFYTQKADAYKKYIKETYSFSAFNDNLNRIMHERMQS